MSGRRDDAPRVIVVGGGLAGMAAASALARSGCRVELHEARRRLGGRASSWRDPATGELVDFCRHVGMGCCTNWLDFCRRHGLLEMLRRDRTVRFFAPDGSAATLAGAWWLPAPLHLLPSLVRMRHLSQRDRLGIARAMFRLMRLPSDDDSQSFGAWLRAHGQTATAIDGFWGPVVVSALGEALERSSLRYARKVFVDGFLNHRNAYEIDVPTVPLGELYGDRLAHALRRLGVELWTESPGRELTTTPDGAWRVACGASPPREADAVVVALPWRRAAELLAPLADRWPEVRRWNDFGSAPISGVHLWFDRPIADVPHAVLTGTLAQWVFTESDARSTSGECYVQVVVSAAYDLESLPKNEAIDRIAAELRGVFPRAVAARLLRWKIVTEPEAVFSARPGIDALRPSQATPLPGLFVAGDWTATGWPSTMEGAVRSGYLAAERTLERFGMPQRVVVDDLPRAWLSRLLVRR